MNPRPKNATRSHYVRSLHFQVIAPPRWQKTANGSASLYFIRAWCEANQALRSVLSDVQAQGNGSDPEPKRDRFLGGQSQVVVGR